MGEIDELGMSWNELEYDELSISYYRFSSLHLNQNNNHYMCMLLK